MLMTLSAAQEKVLSRMRDGEVLMRVPADDWHFVAKFFPDNGYVQDATINKLTRLGLIKLDEDDRAYELTEGGVRVPCDYLT